MKIDYAGRIWDFDLLGMPVRDCEAVEKYVGKGMGEWANQLAAGSIKSLTALWWAIRAQNGENPGPIGQPPDDFQPLRLMTAYAEAERAEEAAAAAAAETGPDPTTDGRGAASTTRGRAAASRSRPG